MSLVILAPQVLSPLLQTLSDLHQDQLSRGLRTA